MFSTWGSLGDLHPYLALAVELTRRGHRAVVATLPSWREAVEKAGVGFHPVGPDIPQDEAEGRELVRRVLDARDGPRYLFEKVLGPATRESYDALLAGVQAEGGADLLVTHLIPLTGPLVARKTGIRWVSALVQPLGLLSAYDPADPAAGAMAASGADAASVDRPSMFAIAALATRRWIRPTERLARSSSGCRRAVIPYSRGSTRRASRWRCFRKCSANASRTSRRRRSSPAFLFTTRRPNARSNLHCSTSSTPGDPPILVTLGSSAVWIAGDFYLSSIEAITRLGRRALLLTGEDTARLTASGLPRALPRSRMRRTAW